MTSHGNGSIGHSSNEEHVGKNPISVGVADLGGVPQQGIQHFADVLGMFQNALAQFQNAQAQAQEVPTFAKNLKRIRKLGVETFKGTLDPEEAHHWLLKAEQVLEIIQCAPETWVRYVGCLLDGDALTWWKQVKRICGDQVNTWTDFKKEFNDKYFPQTFRDEKMIEFMTLKQNEMTVAQYEHRFAALAYYAPFVGTEEEKCIRFERGLNPDIKMDVINYRIRDFRLLVETTIRTEKALNETTQSWAANQSESTDASSMGSYKKYWNGSCSTFRGGARSDFVPACNTCGRHHKGVCWKRRRITCYGCGEVGHYRNECPQVTETATEAPFQIAGQGDAIDNTVGVNIGRGIGRSSSGNDGQNVIVGAQTRKQPYTPDVISGTISIFDTPALAIIDPGATHSFMTSEFSLKVSGRVEHLGSEMRVSFPAGDATIVNKVVKDCPITVGEKVFPADLTILDFKDFDVILGMDWLSQYRAVINCYTKEVTLGTDVDNRVIFLGNGQ